MASGLVGSEILKIAADIREMVKTGTEVCNLTVGDFDPSQFPIPTVLCDAIRDALAAGETNYPPANGVAELRVAFLATHRASCEIVRADRPLVEGDTAWYRPRAAAPDAAPAAASPGPRPPRGRDPLRGRVGVRYLASSAGVEGRTLSQPALEAR